MATAENCAGLEMGIFEVTLRCQCRCPGCYVAKDRRGNDSLADMTVDQAMHILDECKTAKGGADISKVHVVGGEPLLWPKIRDWVEELSSRSISTRIYTNMLEIRKEFANWLKQKNVEITGKLNIDPNGGDDAWAVQAAAIGCTPETARKMVSKIQILRDAGFGKDSLRLNNVIRKANLPYVEGFYRWCLDQNVTPDFELMCTGTGFSDDYWHIAPTAEELASMIHSLQQIRSERDLPQERIAMPHIFKGCLKYRNQLYFCLNGNIQACSADHMPVLATMTDPDPITKAWTSKQIRDRWVLNQEAVKEPCHSCDTWDICAGGCRATAESSGDSFAGYSLCPKPLL